MSLEIPYRLLDHPFYRAWNRGEVSIEALSKYAAAYQKFMDRVPEWWQRVITEISIQSETGEEIVEEERKHADLWQKWADELPETKEVPELNSMFETLEEFSAIELAGALHAYEIQQPEVAETKKKGLLEHYGFSEDDLDFFDEHIHEEDEHIAFGQSIREDSEETEGFDRGFEEGSRAVYRSLFAFC